ncbi:MAG: nuclear transport factor 2 family protein [Bacteroidales bacterium]|nr:nuclear transport factor 2 family protein [Bacteroidales bacterium]
MDNKNKIEVIENFICSYNHFDIDGMLKDIHENIVFESISNGEIDLACHGIHEFREQAEYAKNYFKERRERILKVNVVDNDIEIDIDFSGKLARDLSRDLKTGDILRLKGKSIFRFEGNKIISIKDISE